LTYLKIRLNLKVGDFLSISTVEKVGLDPGGPAEADVAPSELGPPKMEDGVPVDKE